jgi:signal transduction histidine kinase
MLTLKQVTGRLMPEGVVGKPEQVFPFVIANTPPNAGQRRFALVVVGLLMLGIAAAIPFAAVQGPRIDAFIPVLQTVLCVADLITAILLFAQYSVQPQRALLVLASGYVCSGMFAFLQTLAFPGAYAPAGLFGSTDHAAWFFVLWHTTFPLAIIIYAIFKDTGETSLAPGRSIGSTIAITVACVLGVIATLTLSVIFGTDYLPVLYTGGVTQQTLAANLVNVVMWLLGLAALALLYLRRRSILDLWLMVVLVAWMPNFIIAALVTTVRFSVGWYMARGYALISSCTVLAVLLTETTFLYARLVGAVTLLRRERTNRLMTMDAATAAMAHEVRQPLAGLTARGAAAKRFLSRTPPDIAKALECIDGINEAGKRVEDVISAIRGLVRKQSDQKAPIDINDVVQQALDLMSHDLQVRGVTVTGDYQDGLPLVRGNRLLLQQVVLNLLRNAVDAMTPVEARSRHLRLATARNDALMVVLSIADTGSGVSPDDRERIFDPFFTTKQAGTGLGLSICQSIIEEHEGKLSLARTGATGSVFEIALPAATA